VTAPVLFDSHLHLTAERFAEDREEVLVRAREAGVREMVSIASGPEDGEAAVALAAEIDGLWATVGLHPHEAARTSEAVLSEIERIAAAPQVVAIGETGLDYHYDNAPRAMQLANFTAHLELAAALDLPIVVHSRSAESDSARLIAEHADGVVGVLHCYSGGETLLETALEAGWYVSFSGLVTFVDALEAAARDVPGDRILIETDAPYLAPAPKRGRRNEPGFLVHTCERIAAIRMVSFADAAEMTTANARRFYRLEAAARRSLQRSPP